MECDAEAHCSASICLHNMTEPRCIEVGARQVAYRLRDGSAPTLVFLPGYASDMEGTKALSLDGLAARQGKAMLRLDYSGTGSSSGKFEDGTLALWIDEALAAIDQLTDGPIVLVGSSMGAWIAMHLALRRPARVQGLVGIAAAPDFTDWGLTPERKKQLKSERIIRQASPCTSDPSILTGAFWESGQRLLLLQREIPIDCPVRLIHGDHDEEVPLDVAFRTFGALRSADVQLTILKGGGHRLSEPREISAILRTVASLMEPPP